MSFYKSSSARSKADRLLLLLLAGLFLGNCWLWKSQWVTFPDFSHFYRMSCYTAREVLKLMRKFLPKFRWRVCIYSKSTSLLFHPISEGLLGSLQEISPPHGGTEALSWFLRKPGSRALKQPCRVVEGPVPILSCPCPLRQTTETSLSQAGQPSPCRSMQAHHRLLWPKLAAQIDTLSPQIYTYKFNEHIAHFIISPFSLYLNYFGAEWGL